MLTSAVPIFTFTGLMILAIRSFCSRPPLCSSCAVRSMLSVAYSAAVPLTLMIAFLTTFWSKEWAIQSRTSCALSSRDWESASIRLLLCSSFASTAMFFALMTSVRSMFLPWMSRLKPRAST